MSDWRRVLQHDPRLVLSVSNDAELSSVPVENKRRHQRVAVPARCWITNADHALYVRVHDVSRGGLSVRAPVPFHPQGPIELELELPTGLVRAEGQVVWVRDASARGPRMGARFLNFLEGESELLALV